MFIFSFAEPTRIELDNQFALFVQRRGSFSHRLIHSYFLRPTTLRSSSPMDSVRSAS